MSQINNTNSRGKALYQLITPNPSLTNNQDVVRNLSFSAVKKN